MTTKHIQLRGVRVHNLKSVDLDLPRGRLIVFCGVSGSGKTSLALDTLYAEGQRRYIESFSAYTRQFLERLEKPEADRIDGLPPALAVVRKSTTRSNRATIASATETIDYLRLLFAKIGRVFCLGCGREIQRQTPQSAADKLAGLAEGTRYLLTFPRRLLPDEELAAVVAELQSAGFVRVIAGDRLFALAETPLPAGAAAGSPPSLQVVTDRLTAGSVSLPRLRDSLETAFAQGEGVCHAWVAADDEPAGSAGLHQIDGRLWRRIAFSAALRCEDCGRDYPAPEPRLFDYNSPLGACPQCEGFGDTVEMDIDLVVPDPLKTLREGAIAPWNTPAYAHELDELLALAGDYRLPVNVPFCQLGEEHLRIIREGVPERNFGGLRGFFNWLERHKYKVPIRAFLARWKSYRACPTCGGKRLRSEVLATRVGGRNLAEVCSLKIDEAAEFFRTLSLTAVERSVAQTMLEQVQARLGYLGDVGLGYLPLDRTIRTLSGGEAQRVAMTSTLGSNLVNMLYVLDEPSVGLHPRDVDRLTDAIVRLKARQNTVVVTEHEATVLRRADQVVEFGPGAGECGGQVVFQGTPQELLAPNASLTGEYLAGRRGVTGPERRRPTGRGWIRLRGARGNNLKNLNVDFPLGVLCLVTGVSGAGKSSLMHETLYGALCRRKRKEAAGTHPFDDIVGDGQIDDVLLVDQSPIGRSPRSNPVTYVKAFDPIREVFAGTVEARTHNYSAAYFSFNVEGGRCEACAGDGYVQIDMQFLPDVYMKCAQCGGTRYRQEILGVTYRGRNIAEVLEMTVREAFSFFRGQRKVQTKLKQLIDVGLDYLRLGQRANTLSSGEAQRLKLAAYMSAATRNRTLFLLDEPTTGLHFADVVKLLDCFDALLAVGHSLIVVEHNLQLMTAADWIIDLGPGAAAAGGEIVVQGTPETVAQCEASVTGQYLRRELGLQESDGDDAGRRVL
ncbi:MAG: excinuclease ABC subunit UvrA [Candidatus Anammoximicrobium sp.]|nr:excinuclease ABC subunit UvrA [Candidatus Anammoximicrobium sp.]